MKRFYFSGPGGERVIEAENEADARHAAMVERWGPPNNKPALDTDSDGRYLSHGLDLVRTEDVK